MSYAAPPSPNCVESSLWKPFNWLYSAKELHYIFLFFKNQHTWIGAYTFSGLINKWGFHYNFLLFRSIYWKLWCFEEILRCIVLNTFHVSQFLETSLVQILNWLISLISFKFFLSFYTFKENRHKWHVQCAHSYFLAHMERSHGFFMTF